MRVSKIYTLVFLALSLPIAARAQQLYEASADRSAASVGVENSAISNADTLLSSNVASVPSTGGGGGETRQQLRGGPVRQSFSATRSPLSSRSLSGVRSNFSSVGSIPFASSATGMKTAVAPVAAPSYAVAQPTRPRVPMLPPPAISSSSSAPRSHRGGPPVRAMSPHMHVPTHARHQPNRDSDIHP